MSVKMWNKTVRVAAAIGMVGVGGTLHEADTDVMSFAYTGASVTSDRCQFVRQIERWRQESYDEFTSF